MKTDGLLKRVARKIGQLFRRRKKKFGANPEAMSTCELLALMRHETHRIEKAAYNGILRTKPDIYRKKRDRLALIYSILEERNVPEDEPTVVWSRWIFSTFDSLETELRERGAKHEAHVDPDKGDSFLAFLKGRRSVRVWADSQPDMDILEAIARRMIDAARWAPNSGNRQALRFSIITGEEDKQLLWRIKEGHCFSAPLLIFVGMDTRIYGALGEEERCLYVDAGAAIMQMLLLAHSCGVGSCWNHLADDLIESREINREQYHNFAEKLGIREYVAPVAIIAVGTPSFQPPTPARMAIEDFALRPPDKGGQRDA